MQKSNVGPLAPSVSAASMTPSLKTMPNTDVPVTYGSLYKCALVYKPVSCYKPVCMLSAAVAISYGLQQALTVQMQTRNCPRKGSGLE